MRDPAAIERVVSDLRPDVIFHLAAHGAYSWQKDFDAMLSINVRATEALLVAAREVGASLVQAGSSSEYGYKDQPPMRTSASTPIRTTRSPRSRRRTCAGSPRPRAGRKRSRCASTRSTARGRNQAG